MPHLAALGDTSSFEGDMGWERRQLPQHGEGASLACSCSFVLADGQWQEMWEGLRLHVAVDSADWLLAAAIISEFSVVE